jgi:neutral ceramidase
VAAARSATRAERECSGALHRGDLIDVGSVRDRERGDARVPTELVACRADDGSLVGVLAVVPIHPTVLPAPSTLVSGDLLGTIRRCLCRRLRDPDGPWVTVALGPAGDISTRRTRRAQTPAECRRLGDLAAQQLEALLATSSIPVWSTQEDGAHVARRTLELPVGERDPAAIGALRARLGAERERLLASGDLAAARTAETALQGVAIAERSADGQRGALHLSLSAARLGELALLGVGGEPFLSFGDELRARCGAPTLVLGCTNGHVGYLPDAAAAGTDTYEALASPLAPGAAEAAAAALAELVPRPRRNE